MCARYWCKDSQLTWPDDLQKMLTCYACKSQIGFTLHTEVEGGGGVVSDGRFLLETCLSAHDKCHRQTPSTLSGLCQVFCGKPVLDRGAGHDGGWGGSATIQKALSDNSAGTVWVVCCCITLPVRLCLAFREAKMSDDTDDHKQSI